MGNNVLTIGDIHLEGWSNLMPNEDSVGIQIDNLSNILSEAQETYGTEDVVFLGDIHDSQDPQQASINALNGLIFSKVGRKYRFYFECGNHDSEDKVRNSLHVLKGLSQLKVAERVQVFDGPARNTTIAGIPWRFIPWPGFVEPTDEPHVIVTHNDYAGMIGDYGYEIPKGVTLKPGHNLVVMGHYHFSQKGKRWFNPGTPYQMKFGEALPKGYGILNIDRSGKELSWKTTFVPRKPSHRLLVKVINDAKDFDALKANSKILYKLQISREVELPPRWQFDLRDRGVRLVKFEIGSKKEKSEVVIRDVTGFTKPLTRLMAGLKEKGHNKAARKRVLDVLRGS